MNDGQAARSKKKKKIVYNQITPQECDSFFDSFIAIGAFISPIAMGRLHHKGFYQTSSNDIRRLFQIKSEMEGRLAAVNFSIFFLLFRPSFNFKAAGLLTIHIDTRGGDIMILFDFNMQSVRFCNTANAVGSMAETQTKLFYLTNR